MKLIKRVFLLLVSVVVLSVVTLLAITFLYEKEVKDYLSKELNKHLQAKVIVSPEHISFSVFKNFPYASLNFKKVVMMESYGQSSSSRQQDTLFAAENVIFKFSIWNLFSKDFSINMISVDNAVMKLKINKAGDNNWHFWRSDKETDNAEGESAFNMEKFSFEKVALSYRDLKNKIDIAGLINGGKIGGKFRSKQYDLSIFGNLFVDRLYIDSVNYVDDSPIQLALNLSVDNDKNLYRFDNAHLTISNQKINVEGTYVDSSLPHIDIALSGEDMNIQTVLSLLPNKYYQYIQDYESEGEFYGKMHIKGNTDAPGMYAEFGIKDANITQLSSGIILRNVNVTGEYKKDSIENELHLKTLNALFVNGRVAGSLRIKNLASPYLVAKMNATLPLEDVRRLLKMDTLWNYSIAAFSGLLKADVEYKGQINNHGKYAKQDFNKVFMAGSILLENAGLKIKNSSLAFDSINGLFVLNGNSVKVNYFKGKTLKSDFNIKGEVENIIGYTFNDNSTASINAVFESSNLDLDELLTNEAVSTQKDTVYKLQFSKNINFDLNGSIGHLSFRKFNAEQVKGVFKLRDKQLVADPISFYTMDGFVTASGSIDATGEEAVMISCDANINKLNISKMFFQFEDFGQTTLTHKNIRGIGTASIQFAAVMKPDLSIDENKIYARSELTLEKGELINFVPLKALSKYVELSELEDIKFSNLKNNIEIKDRKIVIPKMDIKSSALDLTISGTHSFDNVIDYHFKVLMSDVLFKKAKRAKKENSEFGVVEDDKEGKASLFLSMTGTVDKPIIRYDKKEAKQNLKENIATEKQTLKKILKDEFGWFKKDTAINKKEKKNKGEEKFIIKWEDEKKEGDSKETEDDF